MAKGKERAVVDVVINNEAARKKVAELSEELETLTRKKREALKGGDLGLANALDKEVRKVRSELNQYRKEVVDVDHVRNLNRVPLNQLQAAHRSLRRELQLLNRDSKEYAATLNKIQRIETQIQQAQGKKTTGGSSRWGAYLGGAAVVASVEQLADRAVKAYTRLDDKMADVQKTTGLTKEEVKGLDEELDKIDTRTSREDLLELGRVAGKLGIQGKEDIAGFVRAADQIKVALSEDLGGNVEESINQVGKLVGVFHLEEELGLEKSMLSVGSAINSLGASSKANEGYIVEFTNRVAGVAPGAGVSIQNVMGLGATMDNLAQSAEVSGTTYGQVMMGMQKKTQDYARIAGMSLEDFRKLLDEDANEAFLKFLEGLGSVDMETRVKMLSSLKLDAQRSSQVLGVLADNTDMLRQQQALANEEFAKATSLTEEYNTKNESAAAIVEKRRKVMDRALTDLGEKLFPLWSEVLGLSGNLLQALAAIVEVGSKYSGVIVSLSAAVAAYIVLQKLQVFYSKANRTAMVQEVATLTGATGATKLLAAAKLLLAGNIRAAGTAFKMFFASIGPIGWIATAIGAIGTVLSVVATRSNAAAKAAQDLTEINKKANDSYVEEKVRLEELLRVASDKSVSDKERKKAMEDLQAAMPGGIDLINEETIATGKAKQAVDDYCKSLLLQAKIQAAKDRLVELEKERLNALEDGSAGKLNFLQSLWGNMLGFMGFQKQSAQSIMNSMIQNVDKFEAEYQTRIGKTANLIKEWEKQLNPAPLTLPDRDSDDKTKPTLPGTTPKKQWSLTGDEFFLKARAELRKKHLAGEIATEEEFNRQLLTLEIDTLEKRIASRQESGAALARLQSELEEKRFQQTKSEQARYEKLIAASLEGAGENEYRQRMTAEQAAYDKRLKELGLFGRQRQTLTQTEQAALENLERRHLMKLQGIYTDGVVRNIQTQQQGLERELRQIKIRHNEELKEADTFEKKIALLQGWYSADRLQKVKTDAQADRLLKEHYEREEQEAARKHLEGLIAQYQKYLAEAKNISVDGVALGTLNPEEVARIQGIIDDLNERLAALRSTTPTDGKDTALEKVDILGFSTADWENFFTNLEAGEDRLGSWRMALGAIGNAFGEISKLMSAAEQREFKEYEKTAKRKKNALDRQLKAGMISQERYNNAVQQIDEETDRRREEMERKQAVRQRAMAVFETIINTAVAVTAALKLGPIIGPILAGVIAGLGAVQTAAILKAPLPGAEDGGWLDVVRAQDGKRFRAKNDPRRRGYVSDPRVIVAEDGTEYVVPNDGYRNPTVRPVLDIIEQARRAGTLRSINLPAVIEATIPGRASGGYVSTSTSPIPASASIPAPSPSDETTDPRLLGRIMDLLEKLSRRLEKPIRSEVSLTGRGGIHEAQNKYDRIRKGL